MARRATSDGLLAVLAGHDLMPTLLEEIAAKTAAVRRHRLGIDARLAACVRHKAAMKKAGDKSGEAHVGTGPVVFLPGGSGIDVGINQTPSRKPTGNEDPTSGNLGGGEVGGAKKPKGGT